MSFELYTNDGSKEASSAISEVISLTDCSDNSFRGLTIYGKTTQNGTPTPEAPITLNSTGDNGSLTVSVCGKNLIKPTSNASSTTNGITYTKNADGSVSVSGTASSTAYYIYKSYFPAGTYIVSGAPSGGKVGELDIYVNAKDIETGATIKGSIARDADDAKHLRQFTLEQYCLLECVMRVCSGKTVDAIFYPMIRPASIVDATYEPYKGQTLTISTPNGLPGIPVTSGGNYTDENGQRWICDEVDFEKGVYIKRIGTTTLSKANTWTWNTMHSCSYAYVPGGKITDNDTQHERLVSSNRYTGTSWVRVGYTDAEYHCAFIYGISQVGFYDKDCTSVEEFLAKLGDNSIEVQYVLNSYTETALSEEELTAYAALHTNKPNTTIFSNSNANLKVGYVTNVPCYSNRYELKHAISTIMTIYYNDVGKLVLVAPVDDYNITALKVGNLLYDTDRDVTFIIANTKIETDTNRITANGYTANWLLNKRCIASKYTLTNLESGVYGIVNANMRGMEGLNTATVEGLKERTNTILHGGQILDEIQPFLEEAQLGNKMIWDPETLSHTFKIYKGADLTDGIHAVVFSDEQGTAQDLVINDDDSTLKNFAYVKGKLSDGTDFVETVGTASGDNRREVWFETSVTQEADESVAACKERAIAYATMELGKRIRRQSFSVAIDASELGVMYNLGDIVSCVSIRFDVSFNARITGIKYTLDNRKSKTEIILGEPILTALGEMKLNG